MSIAAAHACKAASCLRGAIAIADPYHRADAIWQAALCVRSAADRLWGDRAELCAEIAWTLEEGCEAGTDPPDARFLYGSARRLERVFSEKRGGRLEERGKAMAESGGL